MAGCEEVEGSGVIELLRSARLGRHTLALGAMGIRGIYDGHVEELVAGLPCLQVKEPCNHLKQKTLSFVSLVGNNGRNRKYRLVLWRACSISCWVP